MTASLLKHDERGWSSIVDHATELWHNNCITFYFYLFIEKPKGSIQTGNESRESTSTSRSTTAPMSTLRLRRPSDCPDERLTHASISTVSSDMRRSITRHCCHTHTHTHTHTVSLALIDMRTRRRRRARHVPELTKNILARHELDAGTCQKSESDHRRRGAWHSRYDYRR